MTTIGICMAVLLVYAIGTVVATTLVSVLKTMRELAHQPVQPKIIRIILVMGSWLTVFYLCTAQVYGFYKENKKRLDQ